MRLGRFGGGVALAAGLVAASATLATTISFRDSSFEDPVVQQGSFTWYRNGEVLDNAWAVGGGGVTLFNKSYTHDGVTYNAQSGNQFVALSGPGVDASAGSVTYTLTAEPNIDYHFSFYVGNAPWNTRGATVNVWIIINGHTPPRPLSASNSHVTARAINWQQVPGEFTFKPEDVSGAQRTTVQLKFANGNPGGGFVGLDSFSVVACPRGVIELRCQGGP